MNIRARLMRLLRVVISLARKRPLLALAGGVGAAGAAVVAFRAIAPAAAARALPDLGGGSERAPDMFAGLTPAQALDVIGSIDSALSLPLTRYSRLLSAPRSDGSRYPARHVLIRAAVKAAGGAPVVGFPPMTDQGGALTPEWAKALALYDAREGEWAVVADEIERWEAPAPGWLNTMRSLVAAASSAASGSLGPALRFLIPSSPGSRVPPPPNRYASWDSDERALLDTLRANRTPDGLTWQEQLSGAVPISHGVAAIAGPEAADKRAAAAARIRVAAAGRLSEAMSMAPDALILKAALLSRRWPTPGVTPIGEWPRGSSPRPVPRPANQANGTNNQASGGGIVGNQANGTNNQASGGGFVADQSQGGGTW